MSLFSKALNEQINLKNLKKAEEEKKKQHTLTLLLHAKEQMDKAGVINGSIMGDKPPMWAWEVVNTPPEGSVCKVYESPIL